MIRNAQGGYAAWGLDVTANTRSKRWAYYPLQFPTTYMAGFAQMAGPVGDIFAVSAPYNANLAAAEVSIMSTYTVASADVPAIKYVFIGF